MSFTLDEDQQLLRDSIREFVDKEVIPNASKWNHNHEFPHEAVNQCKEMGLLGICVPKEYGGSALTALDYAIIIEELSRGCASLGVIVSVNNSLALDPILKFGNEEQKEKYVPSLASGEKIGCFGLTEPGAGSDAGSQQTTYIDKGDHFEITGSKNFITNGPEADVCVLIATKDPSLGNRGATAFIVEKSFSGYSLGRIEKKMGIHASGTSSIVLEKLKVPKENLLGEEGQGFKVAMATLDGGRIGIAAQSVGIAQAALDVAVKYSQERQQFGQPICDFQGIRWMLADMATNVEAARLLTWRAANRRAAGVRHSLESAQAKLFASEVATKVADKAVQIHGGYGYIKEYLPERLLRDARICEIYEGTSEIQRLVIAKAILKEATIICS